MSETGYITLRLRAKRDQTNDANLKALLDEAAVVIDGRDRGADRQYRNGYMQAWREWSDCAKNGPISDVDRASLEARRAHMENR